jgi:hypothetical protein
MNCGESAVDAWCQTFLDELAGRDRTPIQRSGGGEGTITSKSDPLTRDSDSSP